MIALFPESVSGRLATSEEDWVELFGGPSKDKVAAAKAALEATEGVAESKEGEDAAGTGRKVVMGTLAAFGLGHRPESVVGAVGATGDESEGAGKDSRSAGSGEKGLSVKEKLGESSLLAVSPRGHGGEGRLTPFPALSSSQLNRRSRSSRSCTTCLIDDRRYSARCRTFLPPRSALSRPRCQRSRPCPRTSSSRSRPSPSPA